MSEPSEKTPNNASPRTAGDRIRARREELGISLSRRGERAGVGRGYGHETKPTPNPKPSAETLYSRGVALDPGGASPLGRGKAAGGFRGEPAALDTPPPPGESARQDKIPED